MELHSFYFNPLQPIFDILASLESSLQRKEEIGKKIDFQINENEILWQKLTPTDVEILKYKEIIEENRIIIQKKTLIKQTRIK